MQKKWEREGSICIRNKDEKTAEAFSSSAVLILTRIASDSAEGWFGFEKRFSSQIHIPLKTGLWVKEQFAPSVLRTSTTRSARVHVPQILQLKFGVRI